MLQAGGFCVEIRKILVKYFYDNGTMILLLRIILIAGEIQLWNRYSIRVLIIGGKNAYIISDRYNIRLDSREDHGREKRRLH